MFKLCLWDKWYFVGAWVITEGLCVGASKEIGDIFQEDLPRTIWAEKRDHTNIPLIAMAPWGILADRQPLDGIFVRIVY